METFVLAIGRQWSVLRLRAEICKNLHRGFDSRRRLRTEQIAWFWTCEARVLETLIVRLVTLSRKSVDRSKGLSDEGKALLCKGVRARRIGSTSESSDWTARPDGAA